MIITIKQLEQISEGKIFAPQTISEAVLVKNSKKEVITLNEVLDTKIENIITPPGSGLQNTKQGTSIFLTQVDIIEPNKMPENTRIQYNSKGIIVKTAPVENLTISVDNNSYINYNGDDPCKIKFGDDFKIDNKNNIILKWTNYGNV